MSTTKKAVGRPTVMTDDVIRKIEEVAALDGSVEEMAYYAGIHRDTIYAKMKEDEAFSDRINALRQRPILKARQTIVKALDNPAQANWYLDRKRKMEFSTRTEQDITSKGEKLDSSVDLKAMADKFDEFFKKQNS